MDEYFEEWSKTEDRATTQKKSLKKRVPKTSCFYFGWFFGESVPYFEIETTSDWSKKELKAYSIQGMELNFNHNLLTLKQKDISTNFVFQKMCVQIIELAQSGKDQDDATREVLTEYIDFFKKGRQTFGPEKQAGLYGELYLLENLLKKFPGKETDIVDGWKGPLSSYHDFQFKKGSVEVKTTRGKNPIQVIIGNEKQLSHTGHPALWLNAYSLVEVDSGDTLPKIIHRIESKIKPKKPALRRFVQLLSMYIPRDEFDTLERGFNVDKVYWFKISDGFPAITQIPKGIGSISYGLLVNEIKTKYVSNQDKCFAVIDL